MTNFDKIRLGDLALFCRVVETGSFAAAARASHESPRQVSRRIGAMEREVGLQLFHRSTRSLSTTPEGNRLYGAVRDAVSDLNAASDVLAAPNAIEGLVRLQIPTMLTLPVLTWMAEISELHPGLRFDVKVADTIGDLLVEGLDLALTALPPDKTDLLRRKVGSITPQLFASQAYVEKHGLPATPAELSNHRALLFRSGDVQTHWTLINQHGEERSVPVQGRFECSDSRALAAAVEAGLGIGMRAPWTPQNVPLVPVLPDWRFGGVEMFLVIAPGRHRLARVRLAIDMLAELCAKLCESDWGRLNA